MATSLDYEVVSEYLDYAQRHAARGNGWAEGYWIGRAVEHAHQNAIGHEALVSEFESRGLDTAVIATPKPRDPEGQWI